ncbi:guanylate kinase [Thermosipho melanesiensis]|uniref:Guanylate kinase n=2 Tax=Thermosipho melanesiensis TaxID=46541 RepID=A6LJ75_THEM4|nr:guanylate kinase [Thermosipho melanesiensis]ABR29976.1 Guanylate kinase [Thermosipho melanesiensis BI429]APT73180.1 guanylate kinase [Thermosipho melanesiensis]OOC38576.1 guanylate kinase [Thermosipho melanesiensis]OOC40380.1 guanylate kinase [Thermosipho melanesiensis]OOC40644.1 guanylate kinase [Thermosipho melanesiensis]
MEGTLIVVSGPSGVGKTSIINALLNKLDRIVFSVSCTTRPPRPGEINGVDYFFISKEEFKKMRENGEFLEWAQVHGNLYGTPKKFVVENIKKGNRIILDIDVQGALQVKKNFSDAVFVFVAPPSYKVLRDRLLKRGTESEEIMLKRFENAKWEMSKIKEFDYLIINSDLEKSIIAMKSIVIAESYKTKRIFDEELEEKLLKGGK